MSEDNPENISPRTPSKLPEAAPGTDPDAVEQLKSTGETHEKGVKTPENSASC